MIGMGSSPQCRPPKIPKSTRLTVDEVARGYFLAVLYSQLPPLRDAAFLIQRGSLPDINTSLGAFHRMHLHQVYMVEPISTCEEIRFRPENRCFTTSILGGPWVGPCYHQFLEVILLLVALLSHPTIKWVWLPELL